MSSENTNNSIVVDGLGVAAEHPVFLLRMREPVIFPFALTSVPVDGRNNLNALDGAMRDDRLVAVFNEVPQTDELNRLPFPGTLSQFNDSGVQRAAVGALARVVKEIRMPDNSRRIVVRGLKRIIGISMLKGVNEAPMVRYRVMPESGSDNFSNDNLGRQKGVVRMFQELLQFQPGIPEELQLAVVGAASPSRCADTLADAMNFAYAEKLMLLTAPNVEARLDMLTVLLNRELEAGKLGMQIQADVQESMGASQREFYLREQLKVIRKELGEISSNADVAELTERLSKVKVPEKVEETVKKELDRLELIPQNAPEYHISYNYISWLLDVPWLKFSEDRLDCREAEKILEADHFGLTDVKVRILEFLAVMQRRNEEGAGKAPILCLVGPPGVGKTSIGRSIANAMHREFIRVSLGGVRDEAEIRGHRRTYVGAMPGRVVQNLKRCGTGNPVFMLDEVDKLAHDFRGDPASALLEVLDPEQNFAFNDNYIELPLDLSKVFFIATANVLEEIPGPLRDRMEIISLPGYTALEKHEIAKRYLVKRQLRECGLDPKQVKFRASALNEIIDYYTMEAGVRTLERTIGQICRKITRKLVAGEIAETEKLAVDAKMVRSLLGARKFLRDKATPPAPGCATGMAWTSVGGVVLPVETLAVPGGKGNLKLTGSLGKVMQESAETAFTFIRSRAGEWGVKPEFFNDHDFHIHVPDGATPKDGPSAGITLALALCSLLIRTPLIPKLAMTGEITLQGNVTAIGGVREKLVGALRAGITRVIVPEENRKDVEELPENIRTALKIDFVKNFAEARNIAIPEVPR
ncbi:MAG: endopeptidase La [Lentisphaeria bacterium]|nr:endopeptidase La [Lentisphaeria bacterium]